MGYRWKVLLNLAMVVTILPLAWSGGSAPGQGNANEGKRTWTDDTVVKELILTYLKTAERLPELQKDGDLASAVFASMLLFDRMNDDASLRTLASFESYYMGEAAGETYSCLLLRKGERIKGPLEAILRLDTNDCRARMGEKSRLCRTKPTIDAEIQVTLRAIAEKRTCNLEP